MPLFINLPAKAYQYILTGCADVQLPQAQQGQGQKRIEITIKTLKQLSVSELIKSRGLHLDRSPVRPHIYALRTAWQMLKNMCAKECNICAFIAEDDKDIRRVRWGRPFVIYLVPRHLDVERRDDVYVLMLYSFPRQPEQQLVQQQSEKPPKRPYVIYLPRDIVKHSGGSVLDLRLKIKLPDSEEVEFAASKALVAPAREVSVYPAWLALEVNVDMQDGPSVPISRLSSLLNLVYLGSTVVAKGKRYYAQLPGVVMYDVAGWNLPQLTSSAEGIEVRAGVRFDELVRWLLSSNTLDALAKVLVNNIVAQTAAALCGSERRWIFERIVDVNVMGHAISLSSPIFRNVLKAYRAWLVNRSSNVQSVISIYINTLSEIFKDNQCNKKLNSIMSRLVGTSGGQASLQHDVAVMRDAVALTALMLGGHGVAHIIARALGAASAGSLGEVVEIRLNASYIREYIRTHRRVSLGRGNDTLGGTFLASTFTKFSKDRQQEMIYNGVFLLKVADKLEQDAEVLIRVYNLRRSLDLPGGVQLQTELKRRIQGVLFKNGGDRCNQWYWEEERKRLERAWAAIKGSTPPGLMNIESFMGNLPSQPQPPRDMFRFLLRDLVKEVYNKNRQALNQYYHTADEFAQNFLRGEDREYLQYVWPRYVKYCSDSCHLCTRLIRGACVMPAVQEALYTSKHIAKYILQKAGLL